MTIKVWGLTGFAGSGKSAAMEYLAGEGYPTCDADELAAEVLDASTPEGRANIEELRTLLGPSAVTANSEANRTFLRQVIFENSLNRKKFEEWIFPKIIAKFEPIRKKWEEYEHSIGFIEGARLVESGYVAQLAGLIVVKAAPEMRRKRLVEKRGMTEEEADKLIAAQDPRVAERQALFIWDNSSTLAELYKQIEVFLMVSDPGS